MTDQRDLQERDLADSLAKLAALAPPGPDAKSVHARLARRRRMRAGGLAAGIAAAAVLTVLAVHRSRPTPPPHAPVPVASTAPVPEGMRVSPGAVAQAMPTLQSPTISQPGPEGGFPATVPQVGIPSAVAGTGLSATMTLQVSRIAMPGL